MNLIESFIAFYFPVSVACVLAQNEVCMERLARLEKMVETYQGKMTILEEKVKIQGQTILHLESRMTENHVTGENEIPKQIQKIEEQGTVATSLTTGNDTQKRNLHLWNLRSASNKRYSNPTTTTSKTHCSLRMVYKVLTILYTIN
ncbi:uncharacterized protein LOC125671431 isoform X3 [Ostrea edulis]|uniref:uncharacterized protein LOC125671431 isoform X3 n=1 Tax=Ostrea edulis TaxID=37623 RepID=UPI0024AFB8CA|nr:uncharacterized protein LOC125671431 isoform X3 [Ostrea edulis]